MSDRTSAARLAPVLLAVVFAVSPIAATAAKREHSGVEKLAVPDGTRLVIDADTVDVRLRAADVDQLEVATELSISGVGAERAERFISSHMPDIDAVPGAIAIVIEPDSKAFLGLGTLTARARLTLLAPGHAVPDVTTTSGSIVIRGDFAVADPLYLRTTTGDTELVGAARSVDLRATSGSARFDLLRPLDRFFARTSSGSLSLSGGARKVHADTASGDVSMENLSGEVEVFTSTGRITLSWDRIEPSHRVVVRSDSGRIRVTLPEAAAPRGSLRSIAGSIDSDFPGTANDAGDTVTLTGEGPDVLIESASGDIVLEAGTWWGGDDSGTNREP